jgi:hypothetical protein
VFEAAILIAAVRERGLGVVSVPIETRYNREYRLSHFRPVRDVTLNTHYTIERVFHYGRDIESYRQSHAESPRIVDPPLAGQHGRA